MKRLRLSKGSATKKSPTLHQNGGIFQRAAFSQDHSQTRAHPCWTLTVQAGTAKSARAAPPRETTPYGELYFRVSFA